MIQFLDKIDKILFLFLNGLHSEFLDGFMVFISGKKEWIPLYIAIIILILVKFRKKGLLAILLLIILLILTDFISVHLFKNMIMRLRPSYNPELKGLVHIVNNYRGGMFGFVSSHAANSFGFAFFIHLLFKNKYLSWFILIWAVFVSYSRIYLGVHYPGDILGGAILGILFAWLMFKLYDYLTRFMQGHV